MGDLVDRVRTVYGDPEQENGVFFYYFSEGIAFGRYRPRKNAHDPPRVDCVLIFQKAPSFGSALQTWVSAGDRDRVRTVDYMRRVAEQLGQQGFPEVGLHVFHADQTLQNAELAGPVAWWLGRRAEPATR